MRIMLSENQLTALIVACICAAFFVFVVIYGIIAHFVNKKNDYNQDPSLNYDQSYTINLKENLVKSFNLKTFRPLNEYTTASFLDKFLPEWHDKVLNWLNDFIDKPIEETINGERRVLVVDYVIARKKDNTVTKICKCVLLCTHVDLPTKKVTIEMEPLFNTVSNYNKKRLIKQFLFPESSVKHGYEVGKFNKGCFICINIDLKPNTPTLFNDLFIYALVVNAIYKITTPTYTKVFYMGEEEDRKICLIDERQMDSFGLNKYVTALKSLLEDFLDLRGFNAYYDYYLVGSLVKDLTKNFEESYAKIERLFTIDQNLTKNYSIYQSHQNSNFQAEESYKQEIERVIRNSAVDVTFRPIAHIANKRIVNSGYMSFVAPNNTLFKDIDDLRRISAMYDADKDVFSLILRKTVPIFTSEKENTQQRLALAMTISEIPYAIRSLPHFSEVDKSFIILCFDSEELIDIESDETTIRNLKNLKEKGYDLGLFTSKDDYVLKDKTYSLFDYFFFDAKFESNVKSNSTSFLKAHQFLEKLIKYKNAIIVCYNSTNLLGIEFLVKAGIEYFSADCISPRSPQLLPLDKKVCKKLLNMNK